MAKITMAEVIDLEEEKQKREQERLKQIMLERWGSLENEWIAFVELNKER